MVPLNMPPSKIAVHLFVLDGRQRILATDSGETPVVEIPQGSRAGLAISQAAEDEYGLHLFLLFEIADRTVWIDGIPTELTHVARLQATNSPIPFGWRWRDPSSGAERDAINQEARYRDRGENTGFAHFDALDQLRAWYTPVLNDRGLRETRLRHYNAGESWCLLRIDTNREDRSFWVKAAGGSNTREFEVTRALANRFPNDLPPVAASETSRRALLLEHVPGAELHDCSDTESWIQTARRLAFIQTSLTEHEAELLRWGCGDRRVVAIAGQIQPFFERMEDVMARQVTKTPAPIEREELQSLGHAVKELCFELQDLQFPDSLFHGDFSPHNVIIRADESPVFLDWAEAYAGFPLVSCEYYISRHDKDHPNCTERSSSIQAAYGQVWSRVISPKKLNCALRFAPVIGPLFYALHDSGSSMGEPSDSRKDAFYRMLVRRIRSQLSQLHEVERV